MKLLLIVIIAILILWIGWRLMSRRTSLPCPASLAWLVEMDNPFTKTNRAVAIINNLAIQEGMRVLDIGCGPGRLTIPLAEKVGENGEVVALDIQAAMIERVKEKAKQANLNNIKFIQSNIEQSDLGHNKYDRILLVTVLGEIPDRESALKNIFAVLKPGGILSITEIIFDPHFQSQKTVLNLTSSIGFTEKSFYGNRIAYTLNLEKPNL